MGAKEEQLSYASAPDRLDIIWLQVKKQVQFINAGLNLPNPDWEKEIVPWMTQAKKKAEFYLTFDGKKLVLDVRVGSKKKVLATQDLSAIKDTARRREVLKAIAERTTLASQADLVAFDKANPPPPDPKVAERINYLKNAIENYQIIKGAPNYRRTKMSDLGPSLLQEFKEWAPKRGFGRYVQLLDDIDTKKDAGTIIDTYLKKGAPSFVKLRDATRATLEVAHAKGNTVDFTTARKEVAVIIDKHVLPRFNEEKLAELEAEIKKMAAELKQLTKK